MPAILYLPLREIPIIRINTQQLPPLFCWSLGVLCGLLVAIGALRHYEVNHEQKLLEEYGQAMASMAANRAIDATLNHDLVSLQVILQDIADNPRALVASIHDVENNLLVQAGDTKALALAQAPKLFRAEIPVHDSVAGYVSVNLETAMDSFGVVFYAFVGVSTVLMLIALLSLRDMPGPLFMPTAPVAAPTLDVVADETEPALVITTCLQLRLVNLALLKQQLSGEIILEILTRFERSILHALKIYPGRCRTASLQGRAHGCYDLELMGASAFEAECHGLYVAYLVQALNKHTKFNFLIQGVVGESLEAVAEARFPADQSSIYCLSPEGALADWDDVMFFNECDQALQWVGFVPPLDDTLLAQREDIAIALA